MWVLKKLNQEQELASGKFSSQSQLAVFMGINPRTLNKALREGRNSFQFRGELVSAHQLPEFSAQDSSGNHRFFVKEAQIVEFFGVSRQTVYLAFKNANEKVFKKDGVKWTVTRLLQKDQRSQTLKPQSSSPKRKKNLRPPKTQEEFDHEKWLRQFEEEMFLLFKKYFFFFLFQNEIFNSGRREKQKDFSLILRCAKRNWCAKFSN